MGILGGIVSMLVKFVFKLIVKLFDIIFAPFVAILMGLFPDVSALASNAIAFVTTIIVPGLKFVLSLLYNLLGIPPVFLGALATYMLFLFSAKATMSAINFALNVYEKLKP